MSKLYSLVHFYFSFGHLIQVQLRLHGIRWWYNSTISILDLPFHRTDIFISLTFQAMGCFTYFIPKFIANKCNPTFVGRIYYLLLWTWAHSFSLVSLEHHLIPFGASHQPSFSNSIHPVNFPHWESPHLYNIIS